MEKIYFTKYLPVEGEIMPGDHGLTDNSKIVFKALPETIGLCKGRQKVKLFLCSRDNPNHMQEILTKGITEGKEFTEKEVEHLTLGPVVEI